MSDTGTKRNPPWSQHCGAPGLQLPRTSFAASSNDCGTSIKRQKRKINVKADFDDSTSPASTANESVTKKFMWNQEDEMILLCTMVRFTTRIQHYPKSSHDMDVLFDMLAEDMSSRLKSHMKKDHMANKARSMRRRHMKILQMEEDGKTLTENERAVFNIGKLIWVTKIKKIKKKENCKGEGLGMVVDKRKKDGGGNIASSKSRPCHHFSNGNMKVGNDTSGAAEVCDGDNAENESNVLEVLTQLLVSSGNHSLRYSRSYLQKKLVLLKSAKRKVVEDICNKIQEKERQCKCDTRRLKASLKIIRIFRNGNVNLVNDTSGASEICDGDNAEESNVLEFLTQLLVSSGNHGLRYCRSYLQNEFVLLESAKRKAVEVICKKIQEKERQCKCDTHRLKASLKIIRIFRSKGSGSL